MTQTPDPRQLERLEAQLGALRDGALKLEARYLQELGEIDPSQQASARNLLHYLSIRQQDIRTLQEDLASLGLSSLGVLEPHALASLNAVIGILERLTGEPLGNPPEAPVDFRTGPQRLRHHTRALLGPDPRGRFVRIMVTMPSEAASDPLLVEALLGAGMDVMRINCAHDGPEAWGAMVANLRRAERALGRSCRVQADLAGPKLRTGPIRSIGRVLRVAPRRDAFGRVLVPGRVWLVPEAGQPPIGEGRMRPLTIEGAVIPRAAAGDRLHFTDTRGQAQELRLVESLGGAFLAEIDRTAYVEEGTHVTLVRGEEHLADGRVVGVPEVVNPIALAPGDRLILTRGDEPGENALRDAEGKVIQPAHIHCTLEAAFDQVEPGQAVWFDDGKIGGLVRESDGERISVEITQTAPQGARLRAEKGIDFPDTDLNTSALTGKDLADLAAIAGQVDMVARGDLAVEVGFERLSEVQQEILWLCEAAHVPVIWATQILEGMAKKGAPSRAEVSDASMSTLAECAMLNKGPYIVETVRFLSGVIDRMDEHYIKRRATLRKLSVAQL